MLSNRFPHRIIAQALCVGVCSFFVWLGLAYLLNGRLIVRWPSTDREAGSEIQIDGRILPMGIHEAIVYRLGPGRHQLGLKRPGFESQSQIVNVSSCSRTEFSPTWIAETKTAQSIEFDTISESARRLLDQLPFETEVKDQRRRLGKFYVEAKSPDLQKKIVELLDTLPSPWESHASLRIEALYAKPNTVWTIGEGKLRHSGAVTTLEMSSNRKQLISAGLDKEILVWDIDSGKQIRPSWTLTHPIRSMAISPDGSILAAACEDGGVHILNQKTGREQSLDRSNSLVQCLQFSRDGNILITGCADNRARIWRTENWQLVDQIPMSTRVSAIGFSIDDQKFAIGDFNGVVAIFDRKTKNLNRRVGGPPAKHLFFENKDEDLVSLGANREQGRWNLNEDRTAKNSFFPNVRAADRDGRWIIELDDRQSNIWLRIREPEERRSFQIGNHKPTAAFFDSTRNQLFIGTASGRILKIDASNTGVKEPLDTTDALWTSVAISNDGASLAGGDANGSIAVWDVFSRRKIIDFSTHKEPIEALYFSGDDRHVISQAGHTIIVQSLSDPRNLQTFSGDSPLHVSAFAQHLAFLRDGKVIVRSISTNKPEIEYTIEQPNAIAAHPIHDSVLVGTKQGKVYHCDDGHVHLVVEALRSPIQGLRWIDADQFCVVDNNRFTSRHRLSDKSSSETVDPSKIRRVQPTASYTLNHEAFVDGRGQIVVMKDFPSSGR